MQDSGDNGIDQPVAAVAAALTHRTSMAARLRNYLIAGIIVAAPVFITVWIVWQVIDYVDRWAAVIIPARYNPETYLPFSIPGIGFTLVMGLLIGIGWFTAGFVGRAIMRYGEHVLHRTPVVRSIYGTLKQIFEAILNSSSRSFRQVVLIEWPRRECWSIGFLTGPTAWQLDSGLDEQEPDDEAGPRERWQDDEMVNVFLPCTPNPTTGYLMFVSRRDLIPLDMTVEEGMRMVISGGIINMPLRRAKAKLRPELAGVEQPQRVRTIEEVH